MDGPWKQYQDSGSAATARKPWERYAQPAAGSPDGQVSGGGTLQGSGTPITPGRGPVDYRKDTAAPSSRPGMLERMEGAAGGLVEELQGAYQGVSPGASRALGRRLGSLTQTDSGPGISPDDRGILEKPAFFDAKKHVILGQDVYERAPGAEEGRLTSAGRVLGVGVLGSPEGIRTARPVMPSLPQGGARRAVEGVREEGVGRARGAAEGSEAAARKAESEARSWLEIEQNRQRVLTDLREKARVLQKSHQETGENVVQAQGHVALAERKLRDAEAGVTKLEQDLLTRPTMSAEEFGQKVRQTTQEIHDKYSAIRKDESGFDRALDSAGDQPRVSTSQAQALIDHHLKDVRNPNLQRVLTGIKELLQTEGPKEFLDVAGGKPTLLSRLSVRAAESLRGYLDSVIRGKQFGDLKIDRETVFIVRQIKKALVESATQAWQPYRQALAKWRTLSRPLDIVERKGALRKVIDTDPVSTEYALSEAQVVGQVLSGAKAGNPTLMRLIKENPSLKDAARLHFTQDLFVREQVPSEAMLRTWLKTNERALKQTGLYNEFRDIRVSRETANRAVAEAKGAVTGSKAQLRSAEEAERGAAERLAAAERLRQKQLKRIADAQQAAKDRAATAEGTTVLSRRRIEPESAETKKSVATKRREAVDKYRQYETEIKTARPEDVPATTRAFLKKMRGDGHLTDAQYEAALRKIQAVEDKVSNRATRIQRIKKIAMYAALAAVTGYGAYYGVRGVSSVLP